MRLRNLAAFLIAASLIAACSSGGSNTGGSSSKAGDTVTLVTHDSWAVSKPVLRAFTKQTGIKVKVLKNGDAGAALNQAILTKDNPLGDAFFGVDNTFLSRALAAGIFVPYSAKQLDRVPSEFRLDDRKRVTPVDYGDVCINYDKNWFAQQNLAVPRSLDDLAKPAYRGRLVVENPATSSPGLAFLLATVAKYGTSGWEAYWRRLRDNGVKVVDGWEQAYDTEFSAGSGHGSFPLVVSYASSPPAEVYYADPTPKTAPTAALMNTCFRQVEFAGVLKGAAHPRAAQELIDFMLGVKFQADIPLQMFVFPAREGTPLPAVFTKYATVPQHPFTLPPAEIGARRDGWIEQWTNTVLR
ncbi:MAG: thiamine ABC transporter substrate-binding protein [Acidimicrobiia bacterium]